MKQKKKQGAPVGNKRALAHGSYQSLHQLDQRTKEARIINEVEATLSTALGGSPSPQQVILIQRIAMKSLRCFLSEREILRTHGNGKRQETLERDYLSWTNSLRADLQLLGMKRVEKNVTDLAKAFQESEQQHGS